MPTSRARLARAYQRALARLRRRRRWLDASKHMPPERGYCSICGREGWYEDAWCDSRVLVYRACPCYGSPHHIRMLYDQAYHLCHRLYRALHPAYAAREDAQGRQVGLEEVG